MKTTYTLCQFIGEFGTKEEALKARGDDQSKFVWAGGHIYRDHIMAVKTLPTIVPGKPFSGKIGTNTFTDCTLNPFVNPLDLRVKENIFRRIYRWVFPMLPLN